MEQERNEKVIKIIYENFSETPYPGDNYLQGSAEGCEPFETVGPFQGKNDWKKIEPEFLDAHSEALSFFSEGGLRFFLPAFLTADLRNELQYADPLFHLTHGFSDNPVEIPTKTKTFRRTFGKSRLVNPKRYGALTAFDYARFRLSVFTKEEAGAIVSYLEYKRDSETPDLTKNQIAAALNFFWLERAGNAPSIKDIEMHNREEAEYFSAISENSET